MTAELQVIRLDDLTAFQPLCDASVSEGYGFVQKLWDEYQSGINDFSAPGALLLGKSANGRLVAVGGVHPDPYLNDPGVGRIRHVYVMPEQRRTGLGKRLVHALIARSSAHFHTYTLRTTTDHGRAFYVAIGFSDTPRFTDATHWMRSANQTEKPE